MQLVDIRIEPGANRTSAAEEGGGMQEVTFLCDRGETITVRLNSPTGSDAEGRLVERAKAMLRDASAAESPGRARLPADVAADLPDASGHEVQGRLSLDENSDNAYQRSDEALPDDELERALARNPGREGSRFDEV